MTIGVHLSIGALVALLLAGDPFSFLAPTVRLSPGERRTLERGEMVARTLEGGRGQVAVLAVSRVDVPPEALLAAARSIEDLRRSSFVVAIKRFADPPRLDDLDDLVLAPRDVEAAAACTVNKCSLKLSAVEIESLVRERTVTSSDREAAIQRAFRRIVFERVNAFLAGGALSPASRITDWRHDFPRITTPVESFLYWSYENYGAGRPVVLVTHVGIIAPDAPGDPAIVLGTQILATRYMTGGVSITAVACDPSTGRNYLVYLNRTGVDLVGGFFGPLKRALLESRLRSEVPEIIQKLRSRLERTASAPTER